MRRLTVTLDGNKAAASIADQLNEVIVIYPITPASPMGEWANQWAAEGRPNLWGSVPTVVEMQSEGGATGAIHGALQAGSLATTLSARGKKVAREVGMGGRINTAMQLCFFMLNGILPRDEAIWRAHG